MSDQEQTQRIAAALDWLAVAGTQLERLADRIEADEALVEALANASGQQLGEALILSAALSLAEPGGTQREDIHRRLLALYGADREALLEVATQKAAAEVEEERRRRGKTPEQALAEAVEGEEAEG